MTRISPSLRRLATLVAAVAVLTGGLVTLAGTARAATTPPWHWTEVTGTATLTWASSKTVSLACPSGYAPVSGGFTSTEGGLRLKGEHADLSTNQFVFTFGNSTVSTQTASINAWCVLASELGTITTVTTTSAPVSAGGRIGASATCSDDPWTPGYDNIALGGDAEWKSTGSRTLEFVGTARLGGASSPGPGSWQAIGTSATAGDQLVVTVRCIPGISVRVRSSQIGVVAGSHSVNATCSAGERVLNGGVQPVTPQSGGTWQDHGYTWASGSSRTSWTATVKSPGSDSLEVAAVCMPTNVPVLFWGSRPGNPSADASGQMTYSASDPLGQPLTMTCTVDAAAVPCTTTSLSYGPIGEGSHHVTVDAANADGEHKAIEYYWITDLTPPTVTSTSPSAGAAVGTTFDAVFSERVTGVDTSSFQVFDDAGQSVAGTATTGYASTTNCIGACVSTARFTPTSALSGHEHYSARLTSLIHDEAGNPITTTTWDVTTVDTTPTCTDVTDGTPINTTNSVMLTCLDGDGDPLTYEVVDGPDHGQLTTPGSSGAASFTPDAGFAGTDSFTFRASDGFGGTSQTATATIEVGPNHTPACQDVAQPVPFESAQIVSTNCTDADAGQPLTSVVDSPPAHGGLNALSSDGTFTYTPYAGYTGQDTFTYHATDGYGGSSAVKTVTLYVATDAPPTCTAATVKVKHATAVAIPLSCADPDSGQTLTLSISTAPAHGSLKNLSSTQVTYRPNASFGGTDTFTYTASDGHGGTATPAKVTLKVARGATALSLVAGDLTIHVGDKDRLTARLRDVVTGRYLNSQKVLLQSRASKTSSWQTVTSTTTMRVGTKAGTAVFTVKPARSRYYRVVYRGNAALLASKSTAVHVTVKR
jgi:hypothetical protein